MSSCSQKIARFRKLVPFTLILFSLLCIGLRAAETENRIFFSKSFPGSAPAYFEVELSASGQVLYREAPDEADPLTFKLRPEETAEIFGLAEKLEYFKRPVASTRKVAFTGEKTFRFESSTGERQELKFSFSEDLDAKALVGWFEKIARTERHLIDLERAAQFDRLGVNKALLLFQASFDDGSTVAGPQFLPILKKIAEGTKYVHVARSRAASLVERIESATPDQSR
jgi:hypothetical protein